MSERLEFVSQLAHYRAQWRVLKLRHDERKLRGLIAHVRFWRTKLELGKESLRAHQSDPEAERELHWRDTLLAEFDQLLHEMGRLARNGHEQDPAQGPGPLPFQGGLPTSKREKDRE